jgi:hypothetical protein
VRFGETLRGALKGTTAYVATRGAGTTMALATIVLVIVIGGAVGGCGKKPAPNRKVDEALFRDIAKVQVRADSVFHMRDTLRVVRGKWATPGETATYEAYRDGEVYRYIEEREDRGDYGSSDNRYYFDAGGFFFFYEDRGEEKEPRGSLPPMSRLVQRTLILNPEGRATWGRRLVDGVSGTVPDSEAVAILERSRGILAKVKGMTP